MDNLKASMFLSSYFETLGYNNSNWEFNFGFQEIITLKHALEVNMNIVSDFYSKGGFKFIDLTKFNSSDDTILILYTAKAMIDGGKEIDFINQYLIALKLLKDEKRGSGYTTLNSLETIKANKSINKLEYNSNMGGNGAAVRTSPIGLILNKEEDIPKLIATSITASRVTHNNVTGFLGGLVTALFTNFAIRNLNIITWIDEFLKYEKDIDDYMKTTNIYKEYKKDKNNFFDKWREYKEEKIPGKYNNDGDFIFATNRIKSLVKFNHNTTNFVNFGKSGLSCTIFAYDSLLAAHFPTLIDDKNLTVSLDSLIFYSALHFGDNDSTAAIAGAWYGAIYGFNQFDESRIKQLEFYEEINKVVNSLSKL